MTRVMKLDARVMKLDAGVMKLDARVMVIDVGDINIDVGAEETLPSIFGASMARDRTTDHAVHRENSLAKESISVVGPDI